MSKKNETVEKNKAEEIEENEALIDDNQNDNEKQDNADYKEKFDKLEEKYKKVETAYQRLLADFENHKRRTAQEILSAETNGKIEVFKPLLDIIDNFDRSMQYDVQTEEFKNGITMVHNMLNERIKVSGLEEVRSEGLLDPNIHQAIMVDTEEGLEDDEIIEVLQKGYQVEDKVIRPAMVKVNKKEN